MENNSSRYKMTLTLNVLNHLGINLYSNTPAVLSEVIANAWDADATRVDIDINKDVSIITITDDGHGMTVHDANQKFLTVGYQRRKEEEPLTKVYKRPVMGRKGIGKLSLFSIAKKIQIYSQKNNAKHGFELCLNDIEYEIKTKKGTYEPKVLKDFPCDLKKGTRIIISDFKKNFREPIINLQRRLSRRFSILGDSYNFNMFINGRRITVSDRDYFHKIQFLWKYGDTYNLQELCKNCNKFETRSCEVGNSLKIEGWIGTVNQAGDLKDADTSDNLNKIVVMVRGKVAQEDILEEFSEGGVYSSYLIGEIHADFFDIDTEADIATSSRQKIMESDPRYIQLKDFIKHELKFIQSQWTKLRGESGTKKALEIPAIRAWYNSLGADTKASARSLFGKITRLTVDKDTERKSLLKYGILAFENLRKKESLDTLHNLENDSFEAFLKVFQSIDDIEATLYRQIVESRLEVIHALQSKVENNELEKIVQAHLYNHLWLLDPSWERVTGTEYIESSVKKAFDDIDTSLTQEEKNGRVDIGYRTTAEKHLIIELKRAGISVSSWTLGQQCDKYRQALRKVLEQSGKESPAIEVICIVGKPLKDWETPERRLETDDALKAKKIRVIQYQQLIENASKSYEEFLEKKKEASRILDLIQEIDNAPDLQS